MIARDVEVFRFGNNRPGINWSNRNAHSAAAKCATKLARPAFFRQDDRNRSRINIAGPHPTQHPGALTFTSWRDRDCAWGPIAGLKWIFPETAAHAGVRDGRDYV